MIKVTRLNGMDIVINAELIEYIEATPDTVLTLTTGTKFVLRDSVPDVVKKALDYQKEKHSGPNGFRPPAGTRGN